MISRPMPWQAIKYHAIGSAAAFVSNGKLNDRALPTDVGAMGVET